MKPQILAQKDPRMEQSHKAFQRAPGPCFVDLGLRSPAFLQHTPCPPHPSTELILLAQLLVPATPPFQSASPSTGFILSSLQPPGCSPHPSTPNLSTLWAG